MACLTSGWGISALTLTPKTHTHINRRQCDKFHCRDATARCLRRLVGHQSPFSQPFKVFSILLVKGLRHKFLVHHSLMIRQQMYIGRWFDILLLAFGVILFLRHSQKSWSSAFNYSHKKVWVIFKKTEEVRAVRFAIFLPFICEVSWQTTQTHYYLLHNYAPHSRRSKTNIA